MDLKFPSVTATLSAAAIMLQSEHPLNILSSAVVGGGMTRARCIINRHVDKTYNHPDPQRDLQDFAGEYGIEEPFVGLMTAAYLDDARTATLREQNMTVTAVVTAGLSNPTAAGLSPPVVLSPGTINTILLVDANLTSAAMVNAVITATEAKTDILLNRGVSTPEGHPATGTSTDAVVVACTGWGEPLPYAGPATLAGWLIGRSVRQALSQALA
ncbi:adenosylcobinamide amidohydrolase [Chloroflexota bacterium]